MNTTLKWIFVPVILGLIVACGGQSRTPDKLPTGIDSGGPTEAMNGFSWIVDGELAAMPLPGRHRPLAQDIHFLELEEIGTLVSLTEETPDPALLEQASIHPVHIPVKDFTAPTLEQMIDFVTVVSDSVQRGQRVGVHCTAGLGRSGTMSAAYLVANGLSAAEAIRQVRELRPGSIETEAQEDAVMQAEIHFSSDR